jgi:TolA-binding protein
MLSQPGLAQTSSNGIADAVRRGLLAEETTRDFRSASEAYAEAVRMSADQRQIQATALYRLAECQRQLGDANAANTTLQRLAREYPEQRELIAKSGAKVPASGTTGTPGGSRSAAANSLRDQAYNSADLLRQRKSEIEILAKKKEQLGSLDGVQFASRVPAEFASAELYRLISEFNMVASRKDSMNPDFGPEHPEMKRISALQDALKKQIQEQKIAILEQIDETIDRKNREIEALHERIASIERRLEEESKRSNLIDVTVSPTPAAESTGSPKQAESTPTPTPKNSVEEAQASIDRMKVQLSVLKNLDSTWEKGRYLAGLSGYYSADALSSLKTLLSAETDGSPANEKEQQRSGIELRFIELGLLR